MTSTRLGDVVTVKSGFAFRSADWLDAGVSVIKIANVKDGWVTLDGCSFVSEEVARAARAFELTKDDVLISMTGHIGQVAKVRDEGRMLLNQRVGRFSIKNPERIDGEYLFQWLRLPEVRAVFEAHAYGAAQPNISPSLIEQQTIPLPPLPVQRRIASILSAYDDLIENNTRRIAILEEMARRIYEEWFVRFRFPGFEAVRMVESELGLVPEGWLPSLLGDMLTVDKGLSYNGAGLSGSGVPMVNLKNILPGGGFRRDGTKPYSGDYKPRHVVRPGDIVLANTDLTQAGTVVGSPAIVPELGAAECIFSHHIFAVRLHASVLPYKAFVYWLLAHDSFKGFAKGHAVGTTVLGLPREGVTNFRFARPPAALMQQFSLLVAPMQDFAENLHSKNLNLRTTRDLLLPKLISGELDVSALPEPAEAVAA